jgi:hypothetical protein
MGQIFNEISFRDCETYGTLYVVMFYCIGLLPVSFILKGYNVIFVFLSGVRVSNFQDSGTTKKKQCTIKDMFQRAQGEKSIKIRETVPLQEVNSVDEDGNDAMIKLNKLSSHIGGDFDGQDGKTSAVDNVIEELELQDSVGQKNEPLHRDTESAELGNSARVVEGSLCPQDDELAVSGECIATCADVSIDPVYLQDTDVDSDTECVTNVSVKLVDIQEKDQLPVSTGTAPGMSAIKNCDRSHEYSGRNFNPNTCNRYTKDNIPETNPGACSDPVHLRNSVNKIDSDISVGACETIVTNSGCGRLDSSQNVVDACADSMDSGTLSRDASVCGHAERNRKNVPPIDAECPKDSSVGKLCDKNGANLSPGSKNELRKDTVTEKPEAFPCPVCHETVFCKDMMEFNKHLDNCLCGNSPPVSQNIRSSGIVKNKGKSGAKQQKAKKGSWVKASQNLNVTLDRFMLKQERSYAHSFNEEESQDPCDFLSYEESFAEDSVDFCVDMLSDEDTLQEDGKQACSMEAVAQFRGDFENCDNSTDMVKKTMVSPETVSDISNSAKKSEKMIVGDLHSTHNSPLELKSEDQDPLLSASGPSMSVQSISVPQLEKESLSPEPLESVLALEAVTETETCDDMCSLFPSPNATRTQVYTEFSHEMRAHKLFTEGSQNGNEQTVPVQPQLESGPLVAPGDGDDASLPMPVTAESAWPECSSDKKVNQGSRVDEPIIPMQLTIIETSVCKASTSPSHPPSTPRSLRMSCTATTSRSPRYSPSSPESQLAVKMLACTATYSRTPPTPDSQPTVETRPCTDTTHRSPPSAFESQAAVETSTCATTTSRSPLLHATPESQHMDKVSTCTETTSISQTKPESLVCPICNKVLRMKNLENFNRHIDICLSRKSKSEQKPPKR